MGKRYKTGNVGRKRGVKPKQIYYKIEKKINELINIFKKHYYDHHNSLNTLETYAFMYRLKSDIKQLFYLQENNLHLQSYRRRSIYYHQLTRFKRIYSRWKLDTRYAFLSYVCQVPPRYVIEYSNI